MRFPDWDGETVVIVASGPSAASARLDLARGRVRAVVINESYRLAPWADALYGCDAAWWQIARPEFPGLRIGMSADPEMIGVTVDKGTDRMLFGEVGVLGSGGNSGFQAMNLAVQCGARRLLLVGFDMRLDQGIHWHGPHGPGLNNPEAVLVQRWRAAIDGAAPILAERDVEVINCSPVSALAAYRKADLENCL